MASSFGSQWMTDSDFESSEPPPCQLAGDDVSSSTVRWRTHIRSTPRMSNSHLLASFISYHSLPAITQDQLYSTMQTFLVSRVKADRNFLWLLDQVKLFLPYNTNYDDLDLSQESLHVLFDELQRYIQITSRGSIVTLIGGLGGVIEWDNFESLSVLPRDVISQAKEVVAAATDYTPDDNLAWKALASAFEEIHGALTRLVDSEVRQSTCMAGLQRDHVTATKQMTELHGFELEREGQVSRILQDLQQQNIDLQLFRAEVRDTLVDAIYHTQAYYRNQVDRLMLQNSVLPDHAATVETQVAKVAQLVLPTQGPGSLTVGVLGPHRDYVEMYARTNYSGYLTRNPSSNFFECLPQELNFLILGYVLPTELELTPPNRPNKRRWGKRLSSPSGIYSTLCRTSRVVQKRTHEYCMKHATMTIDFSDEMTSEHLEFISESTGPRLGALDRASRIRVPLFPLIPRLVVYLPGSLTLPTTQVANLYSLLDSLTGVETVHLYVRPAFNRGVWSPRGQIEGWVMQLLARLRQPVNLVVQNFTCGNEEPAPGYDQSYSWIVFQSWVTVARTAMAADRTGSEKQEKARQAGNPLALGPDTYAHEWREAVVRRQQSLLVEQGHPKFAEILGELGALPDGQPFSWFKRAGGQDR